MTDVEPLSTADRGRLRARHGYADDERICLVSVGGSGVGEALLRRVLAAVPLARRRIPDLRFVVVAGPRIDPDRLPDADGATVVGYLPELTEHIAACDVAVVQGGLSTCMELAAAARPFLYVPLRHHFEQNFHVRTRLERYGAGPVPGLRAGRRPGRPRGRADRSARDRRSPRCRSRRTAPRGPPRCSPSSSSASSPPSASASPPEPRCADARPVVRMWPDPAPNAPQMPARRRSADHVARCAGPNAPRCQPGRPSGAEYVLRAPTGCLAHRRRCAKSPADAQSRTGIRPVRRARIPQRGRNTAGVRSP